MIENISIGNFRGLKLNVNLGRINAIIGRNGTGKTSFLEALFFSSLFLSDYSESDISSLMIYAFNSRGDMISAFLSLTDSEVELGLHGGERIKLSFRRKEKEKIDIYLLKDESKKDEKIASISLSSGILAKETISVPIRVPEVKLIKRHKIMEHFLPVYLSVYFDFYDYPERIIGSAKKKGVKSDFEILPDEMGLYKVHYVKENETKPAYVIGRGLLKKELIIDSLTYSNLLLIDEIENSLHPDLLLEIFNVMKDKGKNSQIVFTTHSNEVIKMMTKVFDDSNAKIIYLSTRGTSREYKLSEISEIDEPLSWVRYI